MVTLQNKIEKSNERTFIIETNDFFRPDLKQIGNSISDIKNHFCKSKEKICVLPWAVEADIKDIFDDLNSLVQKSEFFCGQLEHGDTDDSGDGVSNGGFVFMSQSLAALLNIPDISIKPTNAKCDVIIALQNHPFTVLSVVNGDMKSLESVKYSVSVARGVTEVLAKFLDECVSPVSGVIDTVVLKDSKVFDKSMNTFTKTASLFVTNHSLSMTAAKYDKIMTAFWAAAAETTSVNTDAETDLEYLRFLTKDQFVVLIENIDKRKVHVTYNPGCGGSTLKLEVAKRLSRLGETVIVCEADETICMSRNTNIIVKSCDEVQDLDERKHYHIVYGKKDLHFTPHGRAWQFIRTESSIDASLPNRDDWSKVKVELGRNPQLLDDIKLDVIEKKKMVSYLQAKLSHLKKDTSMAGHLSDGSASLNTHADRKMDQPEKDDQSHISPGRANTKTNYRVQPLTAFQHGTVKDRDIITLLGDIFRKEQKLVSELQTESDALEKEFGCPVYIVGVIGSPYTRPLSCPRLEFDKSRVNTAVAHLSEDSQLINLPTSNPDHNTMRFQKYRGTCTSSSFSPLVHPAGPGCSQYWETRVQGLVKWDVPVWRTLFEVGITELSQLDKNYLVSAQERSWCLVLADCGKHEGICTKIWGNGKLVKCIQNTMTNVPNSFAVHTYGTVLDVLKGKVGFIDLKAETVLHTFDIEFIEELYPVCGVWSYHDDYSVGIRLVCDRDITMTERKMSLIHKALK